jgi:hypothetical protein
LITYSATPLPPLQRFQLSTCAEPIAALRGRELQRSSVRQRAATWAAESRRALPLIGIASLVPMISSSETGCER